MECKEGKKSRDSDCAPLVVDLSESWSRQSGSSEMTGKVNGSITILGGREGKRKRLRVSHCGAGGGKLCCYMSVVAVLLIAGQFAWTLSLQFSVVRLLDKLETVEKLADTTLDLTTKIAASAAQAAVQAVTAANKAVEVIVRTGLVRIQNLTDGESSLAAAVASKQQAEAAAAAARKYAQVAAAAKDLAISAAAASREKAGEIMTGFGEKLRKILHTSSQHDEPVTQAVVLRDTIRKAHEPEISTDKTGSSNSETSSEPERLTKVVNEVLDAADTIFSEEQMDVAVNHMSAANGEAAIADEVTPRVERGGVRPKREAADSAENPRLRHSGAGPRGEYRRRIVENIPGIHLRMKINISENQLRFINFGEETPLYIYRSKDPKIYLNNGLLSPEGYNSHGKESNCDDCHIYKEWEDTSNYPTEHLSFSPTTGLITVNRRGMYHIYAQIYYRNKASRSGFKIIAGRRWNNAKEQIGQCLTYANRFRFDINCSETACGKVSMTDEELKMVELLKQLYRQARTYDERRTCYTATTIYLNKDDTVHLSDLYGTAIDIGAPNENFFGLFKIPDK